jgi:hypothetical protein
MAYTNLLGQVRIGVRGRQIITAPTYTPILDLYSGPLIAYSMRKLGSSYSGPGIRIRRSNDNTESDINFKSDGAIDTQSMLDFTNPPGPTSLILDAYTSSTAAYSLRKLSATYSGNLIRVRRTPDDAEMDISFGADGSLDTTTMLSFLNETIPTPTGNLLDNYTSAGLGLSLRRLSGTYSGSAIRVRRTNSTNNGDNLEANIGFDANGNLDTTALLAHCTGSNNFGYVTTWYDQSGNARNLTQTTSSLQPQIVSSGVVNTQFGKPSLKCFFGGTAHYLTGTLNVNNSNVGIISVTKPASAGNYGNKTNSILFIGPDISWGGVYQTSYYNAIRFRFGNGNQSDNQSPTLTTNYGMANGCITSTFKAGLTETARVNGYDVLQTTAIGTTVANTGTSITVGAGESGTAYYGDISEIVIYAGVDRSDTRHLIERHMNTYYSAFTYETNNLYVSRWYDQSGTGKHLTNISMYQPIIVNNGSLYTTFGKPSLYFSTTKNPINFLKFNFNVNNITTLSIISVSKVVTGGSILLWDDSGWGGIWHQIHPTSLGYRFGIGSPTQTGGFSVSGTNGTIFSTYKNGTQEIARANGLDRLTYTSTGTTTNNNGSVMKVGGSDGYTGNMSELIIYSSNRVNDRFDIETNLNIYYNIYRNSSYLKTWYDQSGSGRHAQQVTAAYQPIIVSSGSLITDGGLPSIKFSSTYYLSNSSTLPVGSTFSVFSVLRKITHSTSVGYFTFIPPSGNDYSSAGGRTFTHGPSLNYFRIEASGMDLYYLTPGTERFAFSGVYSGTTMSSRINNSGLSNTTHTTTINSSGLVLGARYAGGIGSISDSVMNEFILYGTNQNSNRSVIENNINSYYSLWDNIVTSNMVLNLDAGKTASYLGTGSTWNDISGVGNNVTLYNTSYSSVNGGNIYLNGTNAWGYGATSSSYDFGSGDFSVEFWTFFDSSNGTDNLYKHTFAIGDSSNYILLQKWRSGISNGLLLEYCANGNRYCITPSGTSPEPRAGLSSYTLYNPISVWSHITITVISNIMYFYINGSLISSISLGSRWSGSKPLYIGKGSFTTNEYHKGYVSNIHVYKGKGLSATEVLKNFNQTRSRFGV